MRGPGSFHFSGDKAQSQAALAAHCNVHAVQEDPTRARRPAPSLDIAYVPELALNNLQYLPFVLTRNFINDRGIVYCTVLSHRITSRLSYKCFRLLVFFWGIGPNGI